MEKIFRTYKRFHSLAFLFLALMFLLNACQDRELLPEDGVISLKIPPRISPDYTGVIIPCNIAPLHFRIMEDGEDFKVFLEGSKENVIRMKEQSGGFYVNPAKWKKFITANKGSTYKVRIYKKEDGNWHEFAPLINRISTDPIDPFLAYRLIPPGYETWSSMGLYQRDLTNFREKPIIENKHIQENCVNCHSFAGGNPENMMFHIRGSMGGSMIKLGDEIKKVNLKRDSTLSAGVYPSFHPSGDYIAYSTNKIEQYFHADPEQSIEVLDRHSDLIIYNTSSEEVTHVPGTRGDRHMETFPCWSADGRFLYFSRSDAQDDTPFDSIRYDIYRVSFDPANAQFGATEPVLQVSDHNQSASFPRLSPDGSYLLCTVHNYGTFPIWHKEADLCLVNLDRQDIQYPGTINSDDADSFHSWSSNSRWIVFSSRRQDGLHTRIYLAHMDEDGQFQKPFLLPQRDPEFYNRFLLSYNVPELVTQQITVHPRKWVKAALR